MNLLYRKTKASAEGAESPFEIKTFAPLPWRLYLPGERKSWKTSLVRLYFQAMTFGKARLFYVLDEASGKTAHASYVVPKCFKFPFLGKNDYAIGPCVTAREFRGRGLYPATLKRVIDSMGTADSVFYMVVSDDNAPSVRGIEKAGFERCGSIRKSGIFKRYVKEEV